MQEKKSKLLNLFSNLQKAQSQLVSEREKTGSLTPEKQAKLDSINEQLEYVEDAIDALDEVKEELDKTKAELADVKSGKEPDFFKDYKPEPGTERFYHVAMCNGELKYDAKTGKRYNYPFTQIMTSGEFKNFSQFGDKVGYTNIKVLWDPTKNKK